MLGKRRRFWFFIGVAIMFLYFLITSNPDPNKPISRNQVISTEMSIAVYTRTGDGGAHVSIDNVTLSKEDIRRIVGWLNAAPESSKIPVDDVTGSISAGIALRLKHNAEITIQYNRKQIIVTRKSRFNRSSRYIVDQEDLRDVMDQKLKGTFFGEDPVRDE
ncbi:hypothetical protein BK131_18830 [Paenibacillus amylolyticus]|uniref:Uncharacterized protein n=1 Tax=Paenibacillus amylolyticus TaxID=1451 RepID=A0A1R1BQC1_PAEAM|nr:hypothetical protein [Paenibacillus amylolyticus]OMF12066.1 hypothetical protein BK131_18830 [Paenibacillus amylolyticus]